MGGRLHHGSNLGQGVIFAMMISRLKALGVVGGLLVGLVLGTALASAFSATPAAMAQEQALLAAPSPAAPKPQDPNQALAEEQLKLTREALAALDSLWKSGRLDNSDSVIAAWERRQIEALKASGVGKAELVSAMEAYVKRMKDRSLTADARRKAARGTQVDELEWHYRALEAEMWLNQEKAR